MARMQSTQSQCCCCSLSVFSALFGIIMLSTGVCLVLNYRIMEVDTTGLPPQWQNEEGKKIVGIILICCGLAGMAMSTIVTALYFTVCSRSKTTTSVAPSGQGTVQTVDKPHHQSQSSDPYSTEVRSKHPTQAKTSSSRHGKRSKKKRVPPHLKSYKTRLAPHQEVINESEPRHEHVDLDESSRSIDSSQTSSSKTASNHGDMKGAEAVDIAETSLQSSPLPPPHPVVIPPAPPVIHCPNELPKLSSQDLSKPMPPPPIPATSLDGDRVSQPTTQTTSVEENTVFPPPIPTASLDEGKAPSLPVPSPEEDTTFPSTIPAISSEKGKMIPPPIPAKSLEEESEEEEEVSQIEEIRKLDKDVANLLV